MQDDRIYKQKYLKYKSKYLELKQNGGGMTINALILTKFDIVKNLLFPNNDLSSLAEEVATSVKCTDLERLIRTETGKNAHVLLQSLNNFEPFNKNLSICAETEIKKTSSNIGNIITPQLKEFTNVLQQQVTSTIQQAAPIAQTALKQKIDTASQRASQSIQRRLSPQTKLQQQGGANDATKLISDIAGRLWGKTNLDQNIIEQIIKNNNYDIVIRYKQRIIGKSEVIVFRLV